MSEGFGALTSATVRCAVCGVVLGPTGSFTVVGTDWFHPWCAPATARGAEIATLQKLYGDKSEQYVAERLAHEETRSQLSQALRERDELSADLLKLREATRVRPSKKAMAVVRETLEAMEAMDEEDATALRLLVEMYDKLEASA